MGRSVSICLTKQSRKQHIIHMVCSHLLAQQQLYTLSLSHSQYFEWHASTIIYGAFIYILCVYTLRGPTSVQYNHCFHCHWKVCVFARAKCDNMWIMLVIPSLHRKDFSLFALIGKYVCLFIPRASPPFVRLATHTPSHTFSLSFSHARVCSESQAIAWIQQSHREFCVAYVALHQRKKDFEHTFSRYILHYRTILSFI